jgi:predicted nuclease of predicted toxin-antitoxin system
MRVSILVDMNLSPEWIPLLRQAGWTAVHWSAVGDPRADDATIMAWALAHRHAIFTHDLDFGAALALTQARGPSIIQIRAQRVLPERVGATVLSALEQYEQELATGALIVIEPAKSRARILPLV